MSEDLKTAKPQVRREQISPASQRLEIVFQKEVVNAAKLIIFTILFAWLVWLITQAALVIVPKNNVRYPAYSVTEPPKPVGPLAI